MCGIFCCIGSRNDDIEECIQSLRHRGPDACHINRLDGAQLAHCRLSIIDTDSRSDQPMCDESKRFWIVFNGEIYNYVEIRNELEKKGYIFKTESDTEVLLKAYIEWGESFQNKCNGMWGLAIWDDKEKELFLSRDRFGVKPLYYYYSDEQLFVGSEMKSFFPIMEQRTINYEIFDSKNWFGYESTSDCTIKEIKKIKAGHCARYSKGVLREKRWWNTLDSVVDIPSEYDQQVECFRELFIDACRIRMRSDVPIGTALSGGVDSSAVAGCIKMISLEAPNTSLQSLQNVFVASMPYSVIDETKYAELTANRLGIKIDKVIIHGDISPDELLKYMYLCEEPYITCPIPFIQTYGEMKKRGIKVTIDGHGADELFGGYPFDLFALVHELSDDNLKKDIWKTYKSAVFPKSEISYEDFCEISSRKRIDNLSCDDRWDEFDGLNKTLYNEVHYITLPTLLRNYDRYSMSNGVEIRMPFLDYRIVAFAFSISWLSKIRCGFTKKIVRDMASPFLIPEVAIKPEKIGFNSPMTEWIRGDMKEFLLDTVHSRDFIECDLINPLYVTIMLERTLDMNNPTFSDGEELWTSIMPYLWKKALFG